MMSEELRRRARSLDVPRPPSAARLAAEALFTAPPAPAPAPAPSPEMPETTDVVQGKPPVFAGGTTPPGERSQTESPVASKARAPRVFRVDSVDSNVQAVATPEAPEIEPPEPLVEGTLPARAAVKRLPRKKALRLHGEVTIIRPPRSETPQSSSAKLPAEAEPRPASRTGPEDQPASSTGRQRRPAHGAQPVDDEWPRYPGLMKRIRELEAEAKVLKAREAAEAIKWIRGAIATYGLTAKDLEVADPRRDLGHAAGKPAIHGARNSSKRTPR